MKAFFDYILLFALTAPIWDWLFNNVPEALVLIAIIGGMFRLLWWLISRNSQLSTTIAKTDEHGAKLANLESIGTEVKLNTAKIDHVVTELAKSDTRLNKIDTKVGALVTELAETKGEIKLLDQKIDHMGEMLTAKIDQKFGSLDQKIDKVAEALIARMDQKFAVTDQKFIAIDERFDAVDKRFDAVDKRFDAVDKRFENMDKRFDKIDEKFEAQNKINLEMLSMLRAIDHTINGSKNFKVS